MSDEIENIHDKLSDYSYALDFQKQLNDLSTDNVKYTTSIAKDTAFCIEALQLEITILKQKLEIANLQITSLQSIIKTNRMQSELNEMKIKNIESLLNK